MKEKMVFYSTPTQDTFTHEKLNDGGELLDKHPNTGGLLTQRTTTKPTSYAA